MKRKEYAENLIQSKTKINKNFQYLKIKDLIYRNSFCINYEIFEKIFSRDRRKMVFCKNVPGEYIFKKNKDFKKYKIKIFNLSDKIYNFELFEKKLKIGTITFIKK